MFDQNTSIFGAQGFDSTQIAPSEDFSPLPAGSYDVIITNVEVKKTKAGTGQYLALEFTVSGGQLQGRKVWSNLNLINPSQKAVEIAQRDLSAICQAVGKPRVQHEGELLNCSLHIKVIVKDDRNEVKSYATGATPNIPAGAPTTTTTVMSPGVAAPAAVAAPPVNPVAPAAAPVAQQPAAPVAPAPMPWG